MTPLLRFSLATLLLAAACSHDAYKGPPLYMIYSPNGEPLNGGPLGKPSCEQALSRWFSALSAGHNGRIPETVFLSDAQAQFQKMDIDHNGYLVSEELDRYRAPYRQQPAMMISGESDDSGSKHKKGRHGSDSKTLQADLSYTSSDPVMSADTNLDFHVTPDEFMQQAQRTFRKLDIHHDGALSLPEVTEHCNAKEDEEP
jgi:hypothetical protein